MSQRINPIGPNDRGAMPVPRVERRKPTPEEHQAGDGHEPFDEELEREMRDRGAKRPIAPVPPSAAEPVQPKRLPPPHDGLPHIDVSV